MGYHGVEKHEKSAAKFFTKAKYKLICNMVMINCVLCPPEETNVVSSTMVLPWLDPFLL